MTQPPPPMARTPEPRHPRVLVTAGPTHEPIDAVRYIANRSSGRLGLELARAAHARGWPGVLLLGPIGTGTVELADPNAPPANADGGQGAHSPMAVERFRSAADLEALLARHAPACDVLIMAAAVADYRPASPHPGKLPRQAGGMVLRLEPVPDLLAATTPRMPAGSVAIGFALEANPGETERALGKMARKGCHAIVVNPLETMDSGRIDAMILFADGRPPLAPGPLDKTDFAGVLLGVAHDLWTAQARNAR